ncbi:unnamed protein product [Paramecium pentaurelia]|uniref:Transmembrane protein n=1 Tax=Paramecium pentaurelia TaxID=43138 RepID=A0A8S1TN97_9CILI|nr:unnamed protein product [Paramecium pentaurelia]
MCFQVNFDSKHRIYKRLSIFYQSFIFAYTLAILVLSIFAWNQFSELTKPYVDRIQNWELNPIYEVYKQDTCESDSEDFFKLQQGQTYYTKWTNSNQVFSLCIRRLKDYNFVKKYQIYPKCLDTEELCGGVYVQNKYCAPQGQCPINSMFFVNGEELKKVDKTKYTNQLQINDNFYLVTSTLAEALPINQLEIFGTTPCIISQYTNYDTIFSNAFCENDTAYTLLNQIDEMTFATSNGFTSNTADKVGIYSRSYTQFNIECRQQNLITWGIRTLKDSNAIYPVLSILMIISIVHFGLVGFVQSLYYFMQVQYQAPTNKNVHQGLLIVKIFIQYFHSTMIILTFGLWMDIKLFLQISYDMNCSDTQTDTFINNELDNIDKQWRLSFIMFLLFVVFALLECTAFSICLDKKLKKKIEPKYRLITFSTVNQSQLGTKSDNSNLYMYFKPQFNLQQELNQLDAKQIDQSEFPNQILENQQQLNNNNEPSISMKQSNSIDPSLQQSIQSPIKQQSLDQQNQNQTPYMSQLKQKQNQKFQQQSNIIPPQQQIDLANFQSQQVPIQKPSMKYDIDDQIDSEEQNNRTYQVNK